MKKLVLTFIFICLITLSSCSNSNCPESLVNYTQDNTQFILHCLDYSYSINIIKDPICAEVTKNDEKFLVNIIYLENREANGLYNRKTFVFFDDFMSGKLEDLEGSKNNFYYNLTEARLTNLRLAKDIEKNFSEENYFYSCKEYSVKYNVIDKALIDLKFSVSSNFPV